VGITRAREHLVMSYAEVRRMHGTENYSRPSRFINELPAERLREIRPRVAQNRPWVPASRPTATVARVAPVKGQDWPFKLGQSVTHRKFGDGMVLAFEGSGEHTRVQVNFSNAGTKWLVLAYANLEAL
jgi:DNA helicase-2/ATP-dependent DNA helicase PcrA